MTQVFMDITGAQGRARKTGLLTAGMVGVPVQFSFSPEWAELNCLAVFRAGDVKKDNALTDGRSVIPAEVLQHPGQRLYLGVEGRSKQGDVVIPTVWAEVGQILDGAQAANDPALAPTPSQFERFMAQVEQVDEKIKAALQDVNVSGVGAFTIVVDGNTMTADKTNAEMYEAYLAARPAYLLFTSGYDIPVIMQPTMVLPNMAVFSANSGTMAVVVRIINDEVSIEYQELAKREEIPAVPENVSAFYNDKGYQTAAEVESIVEEAMKDIPAGGGGSGGWKLVKTFTANEDISNFYCNFEKEYKKVRVVVKELSETGEGSANVKKDLWVTLNHNGYTSDKAQKLFNSIFGTNYGKAYLVFDFEIFDMFARCEYRGYANLNVPITGVWFFHQQYIGNSFNSINLHLGSATMLAGLTVEIYEEG